MATEHIPQIDKLMKEFGEQFRKDVRQANKAIEQAIKGINQLKESEGKTMTHNVEITTTENKVIEEYWTMLAMGNTKEPSNVGKGVASIPLGDIIGKNGFVKDKKELEHKPTLQEIAQFLSESKADFVSVEHNCRFADLPFC